MSVGFVIPQTPIAVDHWRTEPKTCAKYYFCTHCHADHTAGLSPSWNYPIYCSRITGELLKLKFDVKPDLINVLEIDEPRLFLLGKETMTVTAYNANHIAGSLMFLFEGYFGTILHTGDIRYKSGMLPASLLRLKGKIDLCFIDNTYADPSCLFPGREEVTAEVLQQIHNYPDHDVLIGLTDIGKEWVLERIATEFKEKISVTADKMNHLQICSNSDYYTCEKSRFTVVKKKNSEKLLATAQRTNPQTILIIPSAMKTCVTTLNLETKSMHFPCSDHSSYAELTNFVAALRPRSLRPIVRRNRADVSQFRAYTQYPYVHTYTVPDSVVEFLDNMYVPNACIVKKTKPKRRRKRISSGVSYSDSPTTTKAKNARRESVDACSSETKEIIDLCNSDDEIIDLCSSDDDDEDPPETFFLDLKPLKRTRTALNGYRDDL
ncbi:5' exonuclease Apollo-like isoform X2 [Oscarella lobularis]|uniref:5' exonuclease Apollo-like isoform X2 n=1 Tax=Oscarella lobularis TaxID=121494 RepID=UPI003313FCDD